MLSLMFDWDRFAHLPTQVKEEVLIRKKSLVLSIIIITIITTIGPFIICLTMSTCEEGEDAKRCLYCGFGRFAVVAMLFSLPHNVTSELLATFIGKRTSPDHVAISSVNVCAMYDDVRRCAFGQGKCDFLYLLRRANAIEGEMSSLEVKLSCRYFASLELTSFRVTLYTTLQYTSVSPLAVLNMCRQRQCSK